mgnify:FL=1
MPDEISVQISKLLTSSFENLPDSTISRSNLARMWSLELQWFSPSKATELVDRLCDSGWLIEDSGSLYPCNGSLLHDPELGWQPFLSRVTEIPAPPDREISYVRSSPEPRVVDIIEHVEEINQTQTHSDLTEQIASKVSSLSGLSSSEVIRRAERKRRALGPVSIHMAILLLAREQNLEMQDLIEII